MPKKYNFQTDEEKEKHFKDYAVNYYKENKETIREKQNTKVYCECCFVDVPKYKFPRHCRSKIHIKKKSQYIEEIPTHTDAEIEIEQ